MYLLMGALAIVAVGVGALLMWSGKTEEQRQAGPVTVGTTTDMDSGTTTTPPAEPVEVVPGTYVVDTDRSTLEWKGEKIGGAHSGTVDIISGSITAEGQFFTKGQFEIDMTTIESPEAPGLADHLKNDDFFSVSSYPKATFVFTGIQPTEGNQYQITGNLTLKGQTHTITFPATLTRANEGYKADAEFTIDRTVWGIRFGSNKFFDNLGDKVIKDDITFTLHLEVYDPSQAGNK